MTLRTVSPLIAAVVTLLVGPTVGAAQVRTFTYSLIPAASSGSAALVYADVGYGRDLFAALGPEHLVQHAGAQVAVGRRATLAAQAGWAANDDAVAARASVEAELLVSLVPRSSRVMVALGVGGMRDYSGSGVGVGRIVAGFRGSRSTLVGNLRLERPFPRGASDARDAVDVITTMGYTRRVSSLARIGIEVVAEDLEGLVESNEAEGGARLMVGPSLAFAPGAGAHWELIASVGPVLRLTRSTALTSGATRELSTGTGFVIRTGVGYRW